MEMPSWERSYGGGCGTIKQPPPGRTGKGFPGGKRMEMPSWERSYGGGCGTINRRKIEWDLIFMPGH